jgi:TRAP-type C4-dicarboxylate transport system permease small subunit
VNNISEVRVPFNWVQFVFIIGSVISATFTVTNIYNQIELDRVYLNKMEEKIQSMEKDLNRRIDVKTDRNRALIEKMTKN